MVLVSGIPNQAGETVSSASRKVTVENSLGLHMRPVMQFVDLANQFQSTISVHKGAHAVDGKNPMELMLLEAVQGTELEIRAEGTDSEPALEALLQLVRDKFGED
jgi:phosphocarrier protein